MAESLAAALTKKITVTNNLSQDDLDALNKLPIRKRQLRAQEVIVADGQRPTDCCLLMDGFAYRAKTTFDGQRQVLSLHIPGEIPDLQSLYLKVMDHDLVTLTACTVGLIAHEAIDAMNRTRPNLAAALWRESLIDAAIFREWIVNVGRRSARARLAHLLIELHERLRAIGHADGDEFDIPVTQTDLADCLGLSSVHVNRVLQALKKDGLVQVNKSDFRILRRKEMMELAGFDGTYLHLSPNR